MTEDLARKEAQGYKQYVEGNVGCRLEDEFVCLRVPKRRRVYMMVALDPTSDHLDLESLLIHFEVFMKPPSG